VGATDVITGTQTVFVDTSTTLPAAVPDNNGAGIDLTFPVPDMGGAIDSVALDISFDPMHTWVGDIDMILTSPFLVSNDIFGYTGGDGSNAGDSSSLAGPYIFLDATVGDWWAAAAATDFGVPIPSGLYRTSELGTGVFTSMDAAFSGFFPHGIWSLHVADLAAGDTGSISKATLVINYLCSDVTLHDFVLTTTEERAACNILTVGPNYVVQGPPPNGLLAEPYGGFLKVRAGNAIVFVNDFSVLDGGQLEAGIDPSLNPLFGYLQRRIEATPPAEPAPPLTEYERAMRGPLKLEEIRAETETEEHDIRP